jgi:hypothetical protein
MDVAHNVATPPSGATADEKDVEKATVDVAASSVSSTHDDPSNEKSGLGSTLRKWNNKIEGLAGLEARGITRVLPSERQNATLMGYFQMAFLWFSANITANNLAVGFLGPLLFGLGFTDAVLIAVGGCFVGTVMTAYMSIWGAQSGSRTMVSFAVLLSYLGRWNGML